MVQLLSSQVIALVENRFSALWITALCCSLCLSACHFGGTHSGSYANCGYDCYPPRPPRTAAADYKAREVIVFAVSLIGTGYSFGGKNPEAGVDCSGMVSYVFNKALGITVTGSASDIARQGRPVNRSELRPGDLVFFNTLNRPLSHVGLYIGDNRFIHAPSSRGSVRIDNINSSYYANRYETARSYFDGDFR